jgi:hypothetical protein
MKNNKGRFGVIAVATAAIALAGCDGFFEVDRPNVVDGETVDPVLMASEFSWSAHQNLAVAYGGLIVYGAWFTNEAQVGDTYPTRNDFGLRRIDDRNGTHSDEVWRPLARAIASSEKGLEILKDIPDADKDVNIARLALSAGYGVELMGEHFCQGVMEPLGQARDPNQMLDRAIERFKTAHAVASAAYAAKRDTAEAKSIRDAAQVGIARAYLQKGDKANAALAAKEVPASFVYEVVYVNDASNRSRLGNNAYAFTSSRESLNVGPEWRAIADAGDKRISFNDAKRKAQDGELDFYQQRKYTGYGSPIRLASGLEARYIVAEAELPGNLAGAIALINERRAASGQGGTFNSADANAVLSELMDQRGRDFWLEAKRLGDWRRNPDNVPFILPAGSTYYKAGQGTIGDQVCMPMSASETDNNPNF